MAKAPPVSYGSAVRLTPPLAEARPAEVPPAASAAAPAAGLEGQRARRRPMESKADPTILYLHPDGKYELKRYALARGPKVKVHDLLLEAVEEWAERRGITAPFRVPSQKRRAT